MNLKEKIQQCVEKTNEITAANPEVTNVWWQIKNASYNEMKELDIKKDMDKHGDVLRLQVNYKITNCWEAVIFVYSVPMRIKTTIEIEELELVNY